MTGEARDQFATIAYVEDVTDTKVALILAHVVEPLKQRVAALERPWWRRAMDWWRHLLNRRGT